MLLDLKIPKIDGLEVLQTDQVGRATQAASRRSIDLIPRGAGHDKKLSPRRERHVVKPVDAHEFVNAVRELGVFWAVLNEPPPGSAKR